MKANSFIQNLKPYIPIAHKVWEISKKEEILKLDWNESSMPPSPKVLTALQQAILNDNLHWYPNTHNAELLALLSKYANVPSECVEIFASSDCSHEFILQVFGSVGDNVCIVAPTYDNFRSRADGIGLQSVFFHTDEKGNIDFNLLDNFLANTQPKIVYLCNPNNPTGTLHDILNLELLTTKYGDILFIIDEAYYEFCGKSVAYLLPNIQNLIITRTFSKAFGLASFRIGYCLSSAQNIAALNLLRNAKNITHLSQVAAIAALKDKEYMESSVKEVILAREFFINALDSMREFKLYPSNANFVFIQHRDINGLKMFLEKRNIFIRDYSHIVDKHCRISIGTREQMQCVVREIKRFCNE
ncbi:MAG: histidinol-phosphate transaminase [Helicobacter sp.]|uniref:pyridoxal phosphate-dependent aminotransferase n=1 Tax=Helicobacter sp. TaxID=218 RepID=UPI002A916BC6|nr:histidinol-phosphate transaminase [Helicobacter sp.]MDY5950902.1 histidinol-phosphate transaminase [Helicobacter sp.]